MNFQHLSLQKGCVFEILEMGVKEFRSDGSLLNAEFYFHHKNSVQNLALEEMVELFNEGLGSPRLYVWVGRMCHSIWERMYENEGQLAAHLTFSAYVSDVN